MFKESKNRKLKARRRNKMSEKMEISGWGIFVFIGLGMLFGAFIVGVILDDGYERKVMNADTLDEICTQLFEQPSEASYTETTRKKLVCNPAEEEIVLDDGKIVFKEKKDTMRERRMNHTMI